jgi:hypothetical protein
MVKEGMSCDEVGLKAHCKAHSVMILHVTTMENDNSF